MFVCVAAGHYWLYGSVSPLALTPIAAISLSSPGEEGIKGYRDLLVASLHINPLMLGQRKKARLFKWYLSYKWCFVRIIATICLSFQEEGIKGYRDLLVASPHINPLRPTQRVKNWLFWWYCSYKWWFVRSITTICLNSPGEEGIKGYHDLLVASPHINPLMPMVAKKGPIILVISFLQMKFVRSIATLFLNWVNSPGEGVKGYCDLLVVSPHINPSNAEATFVQSTRTQRKISPK